jgi:hypothetical protein
VAETAQDIYQSLKRCVDALAIAFDEKTIVSLWLEINSLYRSLADRPMEKTFLQLLSTVTRHIERNRNESSSEASILLRSVCTALATLDENNLQHNQEMLLTETHKVLQWQEQILQQLTAKNETELTITDRDAAKE